MLMFSSFSEFGTMLEIRDIHVFRDGRSVIDTRGRRRFRVLERRIRDGYNVASVEFLKDVPIPQDQLEGTIEVFRQSIMKSETKFRHRLTSNLLVCGF
jgi:Lon protease-like protein